MIFRSRAFVVTCIGAVAVGAPALAQEIDLEEATEFPVVEGAIESGSVKFSFSGGVAYQSDTDIDSGGDLNVIRADFGLGASIPLTEKLDLKLGLAYGLDSYDFSDASAFSGGGSPWDDVHTLSTSPQLSLRIDSKWHVFGGPIFQSTLEQGADFGDSLTYGGIVGATYRFDEALTLGLGVGGTTQLEDSSRFFPVIVLDWEFAEDIKLTSLSLGGLAQWSGLELVWKLNREWEIAGGVRYSFTRFRLDDDGVAPDGVGEETNVPIWFRATMISGTDLRLNLWTGFAVSGEIELENEDGDGIAREDYESAFLIGVGATIRF